MKTADQYGANSAHGRWRGIVWPLLIGIPVIAALFLVVVSMKSEALTPDEILAKQEWTPVELEETLARTISPAASPHKKKEILRHLRKQLASRTSAERLEIRRKAAVRTVKESLRQVRAMPVSERSRMLAGVRKKAERVYSEVRSGKDLRDEMAKRLETSEVEGVIHEVNRVIFAEFTPDERREFAPVTELWVKTLQEMGR